MRPEIESGPWAGWIRWGGSEDRFSGAVGAHYVRDNGGVTELAAEPLDRHRNKGGFLHGGYLMSVADQSLFAIARRSLSDDVHAVTVTFNAEFLGAGVPNKPIGGTGDVLRETGKMIFVRGTLTQDGKPVLAFSGTLRKVAVAK